MSGRRNRRRESRLRRSDAAPATRHPARPTIDALLHAMIARRSGSPTTDASLVHIWSLTGTGKDDAGNAAGFADSRRATSSRPRARRSWTSPDG
jgi:hypothetical protein